MQVRFHGPILQFASQFAGDPARPGTVAWFQAAYLVVQGLGGLAWWLTLFTWPRFRLAFMAAGAPESTLMAFAVPDLLLYAGGSLVAAHAPWTGAALGLSRRLCPCRRGHVRCVVLPRTLVARSAGVAARDNDVPFAVRPPVDCLEFPPVRNFPARPAAARPLRRPDFGMSRRHSCRRSCSGRSGSAGDSSGHLVGRDRRRPSGRRFEIPWLRQLGIVLFVLGGSLGLCSGAVMAFHGLGTPLRLTLRGRSWCAVPTASSETRWPSRACRKELPWG